MTSLFTKNSNTPRKLDFKNDNSFEMRKAESSRIIIKYPKRIPVICQRSAKSEISDIDKIKYLVPNDLTIGQFAYVIRKRLKLSPETGIFILIKNTFPSTSTQIGALYAEHKDDDGFLYVKYSGENTFG